MSCDLCGSEDCTLIWDKEERKKKGVMRGPAIYNEDGKMIHSKNVICNNCGLVYVLDRMGKKELSEFYATEYRKIYVWDKGNKISGKEHSTKAANILSKTGIFDTPFLDIGASDGYLVNLIKKSCKDGIILGLEPGGSPSESIINETIEDYETDIRFKCITMLNTLEHVYSPTEVLNKINRLMAPGGYILINVPDFFSTAIIKPRDVFLSSAHLYAFSTKTLTGMLNKCGFRVIAIAYDIESIGGKIYTIAKKEVCGAKEYDKPDVDKVKRFLQLADELYSIGMEE